MAVDPDFTRSGAISLSVTIVRPLSVPCLPLVRLYTAIAPFTERRRFDIDQLMRRDSDPITISAPGITAPAFRSASSFFLSGALIIFVTM